MQKAVPVIAAVERQALRLARLEIALRGAGWRFTSIPGDAVRRALVQDAFAARAARSSTRGALKGDRAFGGGSQSVSAGRTERRRRRSTCRPVPQARATGV